MATPHTRRQRAGMWLVLAFALATLAVGMAIGNAFLLAAGLIVAGLLGFVSNR